MSRFHEEEKAVERGAELLDKHLGTDWHNNVDLDKLNIKNPETCMLGQLFHDYHIGIHELNLIGVIASESHGFTLTERSFRHRSWGRLKRLWKQLIHKRIKTNKKKARQFAHSI